MTAKPLTDTEKVLMHGFWRDINPHPDNKAWSKCCRPENRAFGNEKNDPQCFCRRNALNGKARRDWAIFRDRADKVAAEGGRFFCAHQKTEDGYHRECGGWAKRHKHD